MLKLLWRFLVCGHGLLGLFRSDGRSVFSSFVFDTLASADDFKGLLILLTEVFLAEILANCLVSGAVISLKGLERLVASLIGEEARGLRLKFGLRLEVGLGVGLVLENVVNAEFRESALGLFVELAEFELLEGLVNLLKAFEVVSAAQFLFGSVFGFDEVSLLLELPLLEAVKSFEALPALSLQGVDLT